MLPDGKRIYPPLLHGEPVDGLACALLDMDDPAALDVPAADRPARRGQEPDRARDRATGCGPSAAATVEDRHGAPFYGFVEMQPGPSSDEFFFRHD